MVDVRVRKRVKAREPEGGAYLPCASKARWIQLAYQIIEHKIMYYNPELIKEGYQPGLEISDDAYDALEIEYLKLCKELGLPNTVVHKGYPGLGLSLGEDVPGEGMLEVDYTRPVVHLILRKYGITNWQRRVFGDNKKNQK